MLKLILKVIHFNHNLGVGVSLKDLRAHLVKIILGLSERARISKDAIHLMMVPPKASDQEHIGTRDK